MERVSGSDVGQRADLRHRGTQPQQRHPPDRTLGNGKHTDAGLRRPRRTLAHAARTSGPAAPGITLQAVVDTATARQVEAGYSITLPTTATGVFTIAVFADDPRNDATLHVDQYTGTVLADVRWQHYSNVARATEMGVMLHEGKLFGPLNQIVMLLVCLMILLSSVSGLVIWWKRRPQGGLGVPPLRHDLPTWKTGVAIMLALAIAFPLVGASLIAVWGLDRLLLMIRKLRPHERLS